MDCCWLGIFKQMNLLLTKQEFVKQVTERDNNTCVHCKKYSFQIS